MRGRGRVADPGCGPGQLARYLHERRVEVVGIDLSLEMIRAFYAIVNLSNEEVQRAFAEMRRVLAPGAPLLLSFHLGEERIHLDELLGVALSLDFFFFTREFIETSLRAAGFEIDLWLERRPYAAEHPSTRAYVWVRRPR